MMLNDLKYAARQLRKTPAFTSTAIVMLALGIGATTAVFSIVEGVLLRPLPFRHPEQLVDITDKVKGADLSGDGYSGVTGPDIRAYTRGTHSFENLGGYQTTTYELSGADNSEQVNAARLNAGVFSTLGVNPLLGHFFTQQEDDQHQQVTVLSYLLWKERFHGDSHVLGAKLLLDRKPYTIIGVMPQSFEFPLLPGQLNRSSLWVPMSLTQTELTQGVANWTFQMVARLKPGVTSVQAQNDAERVAQEIMRNYPAYMASLHIDGAVRPLQEVIVAKARPLLRILFLAVTVVLLIACANLAGLLLVRSLRHRREIAVRLALGAPGILLLRQTLVESLMLSVAGGVIGTILATAVLQVTVKLLPETLPRVSEIGLSGAVVAFAFALTLLTGLFCGLAPAFTILQARTNDVLKEGGRTGTAGGTQARLRSLLVIAEVAVALILLTASGLLLISFQKMRAIDPGFRPDHVVTAAYSLPGQKYSKQTTVDEFNKSLLLRLQQLPGTEAAGLTSFLPMSGATNNGAFVVENYAPPKGASMNLAEISFVLGDYFRAFGIRLQRGRFFTEADRSGAPLVVIVNRKLARHYWPGQNPIGKRIRAGTPEAKTPWMTIVGEVADVKQSSPDVSTQEQYYEPASQIAASFGPFVSPEDLFANGGTIALRTALPPQQVKNALRSVVRSLDPQLALTQVQTMEQVVSDVEAPRRFNTVVVTAFAVVAVLLAVLGIYSVIAFSVALRTQEVAIRMALGSQRSGIYRLILGSGARLTIIGCVIGLLGTFAISHLLESLLFEVNASDPLVLTISVVAIVLMALLASLLPARRAAATNPMQALRAD